MTAAKTSETSIKVHIKSVKPVVAGMETLGFDPEDCLEGTGLCLKQFEGGADSDKYLTLEQECRIYQNILQITQDPFIGIKVGRTYRAEIFGMLGYAMLTARTVGEALHIAHEYDPLSFGHFNHRFFNDGCFVGIAFERQYDVPESIVQILTDRAVESALTTFQTCYGCRLPIYKVRLVHSNFDHLKEYEKNFGCPVELGGDKTEILFDKSITDFEQPRSDSDFSKHCLNECKKILGTLRQESQLILEVREIILAQPGVFPSAADVAVSLGFTTRTLRRKLANEGANYQEVLNEVRSEIAKDYLKSSLSIEKISEMLGFSEPSAFSNAFKSWESLSPKQYRLNSQKTKPSN